MEGNYRAVSAGAVQLSSGVELLPEVNMLESFSKTLTKRIFFYFIVVVVVLVGFFVLLCFGILVFCWVCFFFL